MKTLVILLLFLISSCAVTVEKDVPCWKHRICAGDTYYYQRVPRDGGGYHATYVQIISVRTNTILIRENNGREHWVSPRDVDRYSNPVKVKHDRGKHKGQYK